jgi:ERCC4-type nuclease
MSDVTLIIDDREHAIIPYFKNITNINIEIKRITTGDYCIMIKNKIIIIIERKTWSDLANSIKDGRKENVNKLISLRNSTGCKILYLIEGISRLKTDKLICNIPFKNLQAHLDHLILRDNISIIYSLNQQDTSVRIQELIKNYLSIKQFKNNYIIDSVPNEIIENVSVENENVFVENMTDETIEKKRDDVNEDVYSIPKCLTQTHVPTDLQII